MKLLAIGFVLDDRLDKPDGVQQYVKLLGEWLEAQGHNVHYLVGESPSLKAHPKVHHLGKTINVRFNKNRMSMPLPANKKQITALLSKEDFDILHVQIPYSPLLAARVIKAADSSTAIVGTFHILPYARMEKAATKALSLILTRSRKKFDRVFSVSDSARVFAEKSFGLKSTVLPNVVDMNKYGQGQKIKKFNDRFNIVFLGRLVERKGAGLLLDAYAHAVSSQQAASRSRLIICGDGPLRQKMEKHAQQILSASPSAEIIFTGFLEENSKKNYLASADAAVFPATGGESFGIVLIEAMASGAGVVLAGNNPGYKSVMGSLPESLFDPTDTAALGSKLAQLIKSPDSAKSLHDRQKLLVKEFDVELVGRHLVEEYRKALAAKDKTVHN